MEYSGTFVIFFSVRNRILLIAVSIALLGALEVEVSAQDESIYDRLTQIETRIEARAPASKKERALIRRALRTRIRKLIPVSKRPRRARRSYQPLRGSVQQYVARIVSGKPRLKNVTAGFAPCENSSARCVAVQGDPCIDFPDGDCEGMYLTIVLRQQGKGFVLDRAVAGGYYLTKNQDDIQDMLDEAP